MRHPDRLSTPLVKTNGKQFESSWEEAIEKVSQGLQKVVQKWGPKNVGFIGSTHCCNENIYLLMRLTRDIVKMGNMDTNNRFTYFPIFDAFYECLGTRIFKNEARLQTD
ncbi:MAG: molybdopterin-dependent oxidoreductase [Pseudomonadota bacterium]